MMANNCSDPAIDLVISANFSPPSLLNVSKTSQLLFVCSCLLPALIKSFPDNSVSMNRFAISLLINNLVSINFSNKS